MSATRYMVVYRRETSPGRFDPPKDLRRFATREAAEAWTGKQEDDGRHPGVYDVEKR